MKIDYKGFEITSQLVWHDGKDNVERFFVTPGEGFNPDGYGTMQGAKGAVTKAIRASDETEHLLSSPANAAHLSKSLEQARTGQAKPRKLVKAATSDDSDKASVKAQSKVGRSRNKREGNPAERFKWWTREMTAHEKNRTQRKESKLARRADDRKAAH